ncbi:MAG: hypothetical protein ACPG8W_16645 [Candidatus Promineifilaceae bacterium]
MRSKVVVSLIFGVLIVGGLFFWRSATQPEPISLAECQVLPITVSAENGWHFQQDPNDIGLDAAWQTADAEWANWDSSTPGRPWEWEGYPEYDGIAWYAATFDTSDLTSAWLGLSAIDDQGTLWINGVETEQTTLMELPILEQVHVAVRVNDLGGFGGIKRPVLVANTPSAALTEGDYLSYLGAQNPELPLPGWARNQYHAWTFSGGMAAENEALITNYAAVAAWDSAPMLEVWLKDADGTIHVANETTFSEPVPGAPMHDLEWTVGDDWLIKMRYFAHFEDSGVYWQVDVESIGEGRNSAELYLVTRPLGVTNARRSLYTLDAQRDGTLSVNGSPLLRLSQRPRHTAFGELDTLWQQAQGNLSAMSNYCSPLGFGSAIMHYPVRANGLSLRMTMPSNTGQSIPDPASFDEAFAATAEQWNTHVQGGDLNLPDGFVMAAYRKQIGYLLTALDADGPHPGPLAHDALWVRDAAFIGETLLQLGYAEIVEAFIPSLFEYQRDDGYVPAIVDSDGPREDEEWDAQGQLIFLIAEYYRQTGDTERLAEWYPHVHDAALFLQTLRARTANDPPVSRGILPPSRSAEDLGSADFHHYWDDFWGITGLRDAAFLASELGLDADADWMTQEADALKTALRASIVAVMGEEPAYIPNGPEDIDSSAMARGSANSLYPQQIFAPDDPLITRSFQHYYDAWIAPQQGGYKHIFSQWWPYGGMGLARDYVRLGRQDILHQILGWTLTHQTLPNTFAWAEQVNPATGGFSGGDMPHAWAASSYITLIRDMVFYRNEGQLVLLAGVPPSWLANEAGVTLSAAPTPFGPLTLQTSGDLQVENEVWQGTLTLELSGAMPPEGFVWRLPVLPDEVVGSAEIRDNLLIIPSEGGTISLVFAP